jgi:hypothetical protein
MANRPTPHDPYQGKRIYYFSAAQPRRVSLENRLTV